MKVYRAINNSKLEVSKYKKGLMSLHGDVDYSSCQDLYLEGVNTFFEKGYNCKYFFLYAEDAFRFRYSKKNRYPFYIIEYDIPEELLISNIGLGIYSKMGENEVDFIAIEFAIPVSSFYEYENVMSKTQFYESKFITGNIAEIIYLGNYNENNYPFLNSEMRRDSYSTARENFVDDYLDRFEIRFDDNRPLFVKPQLHECNYKGNQNLLMKCFEKQTFQKVLMKTNNALISKLDKLIF